jgi:hypothetical protein
MTPTMKRPFFLKLQQEGDARMSDFQFVLLGAIGILVALALFVLWIRHMIRTLTALWAPNTQFVNGTFSRFRAKLRGTYQERPVLAYLGNGGNADHVYNLRMTVPPGFENWALTFIRLRKGEPPVWNLKAKPGATERLKTAGLLAAVEGIPGNWQLRYRAGSGSVQLSIAGVGMYYCPDLATFQAQLNLLVRLAGLNEAAAGTALPLAA